MISKAGMLLVDGKIHDLRLIRATSAMLVAPANVS